MSKSRKADDGAWAARSAAVAATTTLGRPRFRPWVAVGAALASSCARYFSVPPQGEVTQLHGEAPAEVLDARSLSVLVWNVYKGKRRSWEHEFRRLSSGRDLVLTQELLMRDSTAALFEEFEFEWTTATSFIYARRDDVSTGLGTASRAPARRHEAIQTRGREPITRTPKLALLTEHALSDGSVLLVVNVHAINFAGFEPFDAQLRDVETRLRSHRGPVLLAGDFNTWSPRRRTRLRSLAVEHALEAVGFERDPRTNPLDHAFVRELEVRDSEVHRGRASDHLALSFELSR